MNLKQQLEEALRREDYEEAAALRDRIAAGEVEADHSMATATTMGIIYHMDPFYHMDRLIESAHDFYMRKSQEERSRNTQAYLEAKARHQEMLALREKECIEQSMLSHEAQVHDLLMSAVRKRARKKVSARAIAEGIVRVRDHRDHTDTFLWKGKQVLRVRYSASGFEVQQ